MRKNKGVILMGIGSLTGYVTGYVTAIAVLAVNAKDKENEKELKKFGAEIDDGIVSIINGIKKAAPALGNDLVSLSSAAQLTMNDVRAPDTTPNASLRDTPISIVT